MAATDERAGMATAASRGGMTAGLEPSRAIRPGTAPVGRRGSSLFLHFTQ
jgi:hypothetical protein